jgi:hypothetical protein
MGKLELVKTLACPKTTKEMEKENRKVKSSFIVSCLFLVTQI